MKLAPLSFLLFTALISSTSFADPITVAWNRIDGTYVGVDAPGQKRCSVEIKTSAGSALSRRKQLEITVKSAEKQMAFQAPLSVYVQSLQQGNHDAGTSAFAEHESGGLFTPRKRSYAKLNFIAKDTLRGETWSLRAVYLSRTEGNLFLVTKSEDLDCTKLTKVAVGPEDPH